MNSKQCAAALFLISWLPGYRAKGRIVWQLQQSLFTANDEDAGELLPDERPYAGGMFARFSLRIGNDLDNDFGPPRIRPSVPGSGWFDPTTAGPGISPALTWRF
jgi:hypothetical protein